jgi:pimeloyl-ACP methyl ester carboxylesterase
MRKEIKLKTADNHIIYGNLDTNKNKTLLIFVHGITGNQDEHHYFNASPFFSENGFDTFRFDFYSREPNARSLSDSSITSHSEDLKLIIDTFKDKYDNLILIGHSLGALVILNTDLSAVSKIVLWDPTTGFSNIKDKQGEFNSKLDKYILHWAMDIIVTKRMIEEWKSSDLDKLVKKLSVPCKFIFAGNNNYHPVWKPVLKHLKVEYDSVIVEGATHCFTEEGTEQELFEETLKWIK